MIIGIVGTRRRDTEDDYLKVLIEFHKVYKDGDEIVSGGCPEGGDRFAEVIAKRLQIPIKIYYARWKKLGKCAGFVRNGDIARDANILIACVSSDRTGGTEDTIKKFGEKGELILV